MAWAGVDGNGNPLPSGLYSFEIENLGILVDDDLAAVGTTNMDNRSFRLNFEVTAFFTEAGFIGAAGIEIATDDLGNSGAPGPLTDTDTVSIAVEPVYNDGVSPADTEWAVGEAGDW